MADISPSDALIQSTLTSVFGHPAFRPLQREIVGSILRGQDVFVLMPTGGGKSLCYQLPALLRDGLTVVVSPLIALMKDQVDKLRSIGIDATFINSSLDPREIAGRQLSVARGSVKLLYVAPERLMMPGFLQLLASKPPAAFAIDEAHCISEWGHDFRPEYRELKQLRSLFRSATIAAFTATATRRVQTDILSQLGLSQAAVYRGSFNRPNLFYEVRPKQRAYEQLRTYLRSRRQDSGIVYCQARAATEELAAQLTADGFSAAAYHAGLETEERRQRQEAFINGRAQIIVATIAFGMGIDKPDVRFVVHYDLPKNLEGYYQESGRAGRDGKPSDCILFYTYADVAKQEYFIKQKPSQSEREIAAAQLRQMANWADNQQCRRHALLGYFDEPLRAQQGRCCDVCEDAAREIDCTAPARALLSCVRLTDQSYSIVLIIRILLGSQDERILTAGHDRLAIYGSGRDRSREEWHDLAEALRRAGYIRVAGGKQAPVRLTARAEAALAQNRQIMLSLRRSDVPDIPEGRQGTTRALTMQAEPNQELFGQLCALRTQIARERKMSPFIIFHDSALRQIAAELPMDLTTLRQIHGVGERKVTDFGEQVLAVVNDYARRHQTQREPSPAPSPLAAAGGSLPATVTATLDLFRAGNDVSEIARKRGLSGTTVSQHLAQAIRSRELADIGRLVSAEKWRTIEAAFDQLGLALLKPIREQLGDSYSYDELRYVQAAMLARSDGAETLGP